MLEVRAASGEGSCHGHRFPGALLSHWLLQGETGGHLKMRVSGHSMDLLHLAWVFNLRHLGQQEIINHLISIHSLFFGVGSQITSMQNKLEMV